MVSSRWARTAARRQQLQQSRVQLLSDRARALYQMPGAGCACGSELESIAIAISPLGHCPSRELALAWHDHVAPSAARTRARGAHVRPAARCGLWPWQAMQPVRNALHCGLCTGPAEPFRCTPRRRACPRPSSPTASRPRIQHRRSAAQRVRLREESPWVSAPLVVPTPPHASS